MRLSQLKPQTTEKLTRSFQYVHKDDSAVTFKVTAHYLSPALFDQQIEKEQVKVVSRGRVKQGTIDQKELRLSIAKELLLPAIQKLEGFKVRHLRAMAPLKAADVAAVGKLDELFPSSRESIAAEDQARVDAGDLDADKAKSDAVRIFEDNVVWLLTNSVDFYDFIFDVVSSLSYYQDSTWEEEVESFSNGQPTSSV